MKRFPQRPQNPQSSFSLVGTQRHQIRRFQTCQFAWSGAGDRSRIFGFLEGTYFIHLISPFTTNRDVEIRKVPKICICDVGLARQFARIGEGTRFENAVRCNLLTRGKVQYDQRKNGLKIDFIQNQQGYEVKPHPQDDIHKTQGMGSEIGLSKTWLVSRDDVPQPEGIPFFQL